MIRLAALVSPLVFIGVLLLTQPASAKQISIAGHTPASVKASCGGGTYWQFSGGEFGCLNGNGTGVVCGGTGKGPDGKPYSQTCDTLDKVTVHIPTRIELLHSEKLHSPN
jgi:hypothetical protein